jgi:hypothetical protein
MTTPVDTVRRFYDAPVTLRPIVPRRLSTLWKDGFRSPDSSPAWNALFGRAKDLVSE